MNREETTMLGFEIVAYSGDARSKLLVALKDAKAGDFESADKLVAEAQECLNDAHRTQTELLSGEARGEESEIGMIMVHAQDHLMTTMLLADIIGTLMDVYRKR
ncbi:MAG: PTS lactose/cellobiose transporter subunit IIA [Atopobiaceae bacterium]